MMAVVTYKNIHSFMRRVNPGYIECLISEMQNLGDRMDEIIESDWIKFLNHVQDQEQQKEVSKS